MRSWVLGAVHNKATDWFRHHTATSGRDMSDDGALAELTAPDLTDRRVIELAYFGGFTHSEIADMLELPAGTVKGRMRLGLIKLRLSLGDLTTAAGGVR